MDAARWQADYNGAGQQAFEADLALARGMGVRGFPSIFITNAAGRSKLVYGCKPYDAYRHVIQKLALQATPQTYDRTWQSLFARFEALTNREFAELSEMPPEEAERTLNRLLKDDHLQVYQSKNGPLWHLP